MIFYVAPGALNRNWRRFPWEKSFICCGNQMWQ